MSKLSPITSLKRKAIYDYGWTGTNTGFIRDDKVKPKDKINPKQKEELKKGMETVVKSIQDMVSKVLTHSSRK